jgi:hypothetical protein
VFNLVKLGSIPLSTSFEEGSEAQMSMNGKQSTATAAPTTTGTKFIVTPLVAKLSKSRHQYNFSGKTEAELEFVRQELGSETETDAVRDCIALMAWVLSLQKEGAKVAIVRGTHVEAIQLFTSRHVRPTSEPEDESHL